MEIRDDTKRLGEQVLRDVDASLSKAFWECKDVWDMHELYQYVLANLLKVMRDCKRTIKEERMKVTQNAEEEEV